MIRPGGGRRGADGAVATAGDAAGSRWRREARTSHRARGVDSTALIFRSASGALPAAPRGYAAHRERSTRRGCRDRFVTAEEATQNPGLLQSPSGRRRLARHFAPRRARRDLRRVAGAAAAGAQQAPPTVNHVSNAAAPAAAPDAAAPNSRAPPRSPKPSARCGRPRSLRGLFAARDPEKFASFLADDATLLGAPCCGASRRCAKRGQR